MNKNSNLYKSSIPLQLKAFHSIIGLAVFMAITIIPTEFQTLEIFGFVFNASCISLIMLSFTLNLIYKTYGFPHLRQSVYLVIICKFIYLVFLKIAIFLPSVDFWSKQEMYKKVLDRDFSYIVYTSIQTWLLLLLPYYICSHKRTLNVDILSIFSMWILIATSKYLQEDLFNNLFFVSFFYTLSLMSLSRSIALKLRVFESINPSYNNPTLFTLQSDCHILNKKEKCFLYHHIIICLCIVFFIASKTVASKFISFGFFTINVGGIVFSLAYLSSDIITDVYGSNRSQQMTYFLVFINFLFVIIIFMTTTLASNPNNGYSTILHNQFRMWAASATSFIIGMQINRIIFSYLKNRQLNKFISLKKEFLLTVWLRVATSTTVGIFIDVSLFSFIAFYGLVPNERLFHIILYEDIYKISYELLLTPLSVLLIYYIKVKEQVDIYDDFISINPFKIYSEKKEKNMFYENYKKQRPNDGKESK